MPEQLIEAFVDDDSTVDVEFANGVVFTLRKYIDAGIQEEVDNSMAHMSLQQQRRGQSGKAQQDVEIQIRMGGLKLLQLMTVQIKHSGGKVQTHPGMQTFRKLSLEAKKELYRVIRDHNPEFDDDAEDDWEDEDLGEATSPDFPGP